MRYVEHKCGECGSPLEVADDDGMRVIYGCEKCDNRREREEVNNEDEE